MKKVPVMILSIGILSLAISAQAAIIPVQESSFEDPDVPAGTGHVSMNATLSAAWNPSVNGGYSILPDDFQPADPQFADGTTDGNNYLLMRDAGTINQDLGLVAIGDEISVSFDVGRAWGQFDGGAGTQTGVMTCTLSVGSSFNTVSIDTADFAIVDKGVWQTINNNWTTTAAGTLNIEFAYVSGRGPFLDNVSKVERVEP